MSQPLPMLTDDEVVDGRPGDDEAGFGALETGRGPLPLKAMNVRGRIDGLLARVEVAQTFVNTLDEPLEATYIFPLPDRAAVTGFRMEVAGRVVHQVVQPVELPEGWAGLGLMASSLRDGSRTMPGALGGMGAMSASSVPFTRPCDPVHPPMRCVRPHRFLHVRIF